MQLETQHFRAIQYLALGMSMDEVSKDCKTPLSTLYRWKNMPEFRVALGMEIKKTQAAAPEQLQIVAHEAFGAIRDAQRELRAYGLGKKSIEYPRVMALLGVLKFGARWISLAGFDPALKEAAAKLAFQLPGDPDAQEVPEYIGDCGPSLEKRPATELLPPPHILGAYTIEELAELVRADRIARGLATPEEISDDRAARQALFRNALRELDEQEQPVPLASGRQDAGGTVAQASSLREPETENETEREGETQEAERKSDPARSAATSAA